MTKSEELILRVKEEISNGMHGHIGGKFMSVREFSRSYGISYTTSVKTLSALKQQNILALKNNTYYINDCKTGSQKAKRMLVGVHTRDMTNDFYNALCAALTLEAKEKNIDLLIMSSDNDNEEKRNILNKFIELGCSGVINLNSYKESELLDFYKLYPLPFIMYAGSVAAELGVDSVNTDNAASGRQAAKHLLDTGAKAFFYVTVNDANTNERYTGFKTYLEDAGQTCGEIRLAADVNDSDNYNFIAEKLKKESRKNKLGIFCHHDLLAVTVLSLCRKKSIAVPHEAAIIGYDDLPVSRSTVPGITTFSYNYKLIAKECLLALTDRIKKVRKKTCEKVIQTVLVIRGSTK